MNITIPTIAAVSAALILAGCSHGNGVDRWSYNAGYNSGLGPQLFSQGVPAPAACHEALVGATADLIMAHDSRNYDTMSFNSGCYDAIRAHGGSIR
jgi:hypothetical protein